MSKKLLITLSAIVVAFGALWVSQIFYFDSLTKQFSVAGVGPVFNGKLSDNLESAVTRSFIVRLPDGKEVTFKPEQLRDWIEPYQRVFTNRTEYRVAPAQINDAINDFAAGLDIKPVNAQLGVIDGQLAEIAPAIPGQRLDLDASETAIIQALIHDQSSADLVVAEVQPELTLAKLKDLKITTLLGEGTSKFTGSPSHRIHNIHVGAERFNNVLIAPGAEFSFVDHLGDVDATTGYLPELVIKGDKVIPEYGGGLCQVSTTLFRAAIYSGLKITERHPHSFPVHYYNPQGFDSTIYPGAADLKFINDTPSSILIQSHVEGSTITFDMFGSSDGRTVALDGPHQYDVQPDGSMKAIFYRTITLADGVSNKESFYSNYKSPGLFQVIKNPLE